MPTTKIARHAGPAAALGVVLLAFVLAIAVSGCRQKPDPVRAAIAAAEAQVQRDSTRAARLHRTATQLYCAAKAAEDSATFYHLQTHVQAQHTAVDSAALARFFADYAQPVRAK